MDHLSSRRRSGACDVVSKVMSDVTRSDSTVPIVRVGNGNAMVSGERTDSFPRWTGDVPLKIRNLLGLCHGSVCLLDSASKTGIRHS